MNIKHAGIVTMGKFVPDDSAMFKAEFVRHEGRRVAVTVAREIRGRSDNQNKYYWGIVIKFLADWAGYEPEEMHDALKAHLLGLPDARTGLRVARSTTRLSTAQFSEYVETIKRWAAEQGVIIPDADKF